jgi:cell wall-associated NlpC family hydrolase
MKKKVITVLATAAIASCAFAGSASASTYIVKKGDCLSLIALKYHTSIQELKKSNNLHSDILQLNQALKVPAPVAKPESMVKAKTTATVPAVKDSTSIYTIIKGDYLGKIAKQHGMSLSDLKKLNNLESDLIHPGQTLKVSSKATAPVVTPVKAAPKPPVVSQSSSPSQMNYVVKSGDSLGKIGLQFNMSVTDLKNLNHLSSDLIYVGQTLKVNSKAVKETETVSASIVIQKAKDLMGTPYVWGGNNDSGLDCSGLIYYVNNQAGNPLGRYTAEGYYNRSYYVDKPKAGDLVFFENTYKPGISHMGIYLGDNQFIHADETKGVTITSLNNSYYQEHLDGFKRFY